MTQARDLADGKFDTNTLVVDAANNRVGIGQSSPESALHITSSSAILRLTSDTNSTSGVVFGDSDDTNIGRLLYDNSDNSMRFTTNTGERLRVLSGGGLTFNGDTAAANALDDYEEGTWTPSIRGSTTNGSFSGSNTVGFYTKIGDTVHAWFDCDGTISGSAAGILLFTGLPYTSNSSVEAVGQFMFDNLNVDTTRVNFVLYIGGNSTEMQIFASKDDVSWTQVAISNETVGFRGQITYKV